MDYYILWDSYQLAQEHTLLTQLVHELLLVELYEAFDLLQLLRGEEPLLVHQHHAGVGVYTAQHSTAE